MATVLLSITLDCKTEVLLKKDLYTQVLDVGIVRESENPFASPLVLVKKKNEIGALLDIFTHSNTPKVGCNHPK